MWSERTLWSFSRFHHYLFQFDELRPPLRHAISAHVPADSWNCVSHATQTHYSGWKASENWCLWVKICLLKYCKRSIVCVRKDVQEDKNVVDTPALDVVWFGKYGVLSNAASWFTCTAATEMKDMQVFQNRSWNIIAAVSFLHWHFEMNRQTRETQGWNFSSFMVWVTKAGLTQSMDAETMWIYMWFPYKNVPLHQYTVKKKL